MTDQGDGNDRGVIKPIFGRGGSAEVVTGDFTGKDKLEIEIAGTKVTLLKRSLFETEATGFVIPQWAHKVSDGGIALAGMKKFGTAFNNAYEKYLEIDTDRNKLARVVMFKDPDTELSFFHTVTVGTGHLTAARNISDAITYVLALCEEHGVRNIGFPAMCTGIEGELEDEQSAKVIAHAIHKFSTPNSSDLSIIIAISGYDEQNRFDAFKRVFENPAVYQEFDPATEVGTRTEDVRRTLIERKAKGDLPIVVVGKDGDVVTEEPEKGKVHRLFPKGGKSPESKP